VIRVVETLLEYVCWRPASYDYTEDNSSRRMIAATVLRELRLLDAINIATRRNGRGGSGYKSLEHLRGHVDRRLSSSILV
jgi:hypothetical protein